MRCSNRFVNAMICTGFFEKHSPDCRNSDALAARAIFGPTKLRARPVGGVDYRADGSERIV